MSGADDANGASVLVAPDWEGAVDGAIRTHERIYRRMETLGDERSNLDGLDSPIYPRGDGSRAYPLRLAEDEEPGEGGALLRLLMVLYGNPACGHALTVMLRLRARRLPHVVRYLAPSAGAEELPDRYGVQSSPVLVAGQVLVVGAPQILRFLDCLIDASDL